MDSLYHLKYWNNSLEDRKSPPGYLTAYAVPYGPDGIAPMMQRYFYGVEEGPPRRRICFIKRFIKNKKRYKLEQSAARISSPYVASLYRNPRMKKCRMEYLDDGIWRGLEGDILLYEYLPSDLMAFRMGYTSGREMPEAYRRDILLKLIQGVGHMHQACIVHHDIKPGNILINCQGLCDEAPWRCQELDVKLTDLDGVYDVCGGPQLNVATPPFQPKGVPPSVWLDIYSLCMVALWLYDSQERYLDNITQELPETKEKMEKLLEDMDAAVPKRIKEILIPHLLLAISKMTGRLDETQWENGAKELSRLYHELSRFFMDDWHPVELLGPAQASTSWSAVVQIDREMWPVYGQGREYCMLSINSCCSSYYADITSIPENSCLTLSAPPEVFVAGEENNGIWSLKAGIYGTVNHQGRCLAQTEHILENANAALYHGALRCVMQNREMLFQNITIHSVHFYTGKDGPEPLPLFSGSVSNRSANINLVFVMMVSEPAGGGLVCRLIRRVMDGVSKIENCNPCCYGITMREGNAYSFCGGMLNLSGRNLSELYSASINSCQNLDGLYWHEMQSKTNCCAFDSGLPTIVIGYLDHPLDWNTDPVQRFKKLFPYFQYAIQYMQLFTTDRLDLEADMRKLSPYLAAAVAPDGACILMPLSEGEGFPDQRGRWLTAVRYWCQRGADRT